MVFPPTSSTTASVLPVDGDHVQDLLNASALRVNPRSMIAVNSIADVVDNSLGVTTLRSAINQANADAVKDTIVFDSSLFSSAQTITLSLGELDINHSLRIIAPRDPLTGADLVTVNGNNASRVFEIDAGAKVRIDGLIIANGKVTSDNGGGILNRGILTFNHSTLSDNSASQGGGINNSGRLTVNNSTLSSNLAGIGGGINNSGRLTVSNSTISDTTVRTSQRGGGINNSGILTVSNSTISGNRLVFGSGGAIYNTNTGIVEVSNSTLTDNAAQESAIYNAGKLTLSSSTFSNNGGTNRGGMFNSGNLEVNNSILTGNSSQGSGGGIVNSKEGTVKVSNSTLSDNQAGTRNGGSGGGISNSGNLEVTNSTLTNNSASMGRGGAIFNSGNALVTNSTISGNKSQNNGIGSGGGIYNSGTLNVSYTTLSDNFVLNSSKGEGGGGIYNSGTLNVSYTTLSDNSSQKTFVSAPNGGVGGGIYNTGTLDVSNSTLSNNSATVDGGGIYNLNNAKLTVSDSTISGNSAGNNGGGIFNSSTVALLFSTLTGNQAADGGGVYNSAGGAASVRNTIIAANLLNTDGVNPDVSGSFTSNGYNLIGDSTGSTGFGSPGDIVGTSDRPIDPRLAPLSFNGGPTETIALLQESPAINAGDPTILPTDPTTDQRGKPRVRGGRADIGAFESSYHSAPPTVTTTVTNVFYVLFPPIKVEFSTKDGLFGITISSPKY